MRMPWPYEALRDLCVNDPAAGEGIKQQRRIGAEVADHEVAWQPDAGERNRGSATNFDVHHRQQDR
ncbi:MAG: hypothetical protein WBP81_35875 [Solirubrobacteraceae bacterium]